MIIDRRGDARVLTASAIVAVTAAWIFYLREDLILSHYDAKAHLVVARRVLDNITPGWQQIGAVWLPLPHLVQLIPVQIDVLYRTGAFGSIVSIACFGIVVWSTTRLVLQITGSRAGAVTSAALLTLNPNLLYLFATPMTEPLLAASVLLAIAWLFDWLRDDRTDVPRRLRLVLFAAMWTRFEAWMVITAAMMMAALVLVCRRTNARATVMRTWAVARWPLLAAALFVINSRITVGSWLVTGGFFVPDPTYEGQAWRTLVAVWWGTHQLSGYAIEIVGLTTAAVVLVRGLTTRADAPLLILVAPLAAAVLPLLAFYDGHPFRIRYMAPLVIACALFSGLAVGLLARTTRTSEPAGRTGRGIAALLLCAVLLASTIIEAPPWEEHPPLVAESEWDVPDSLNRRDVTSCLQAYDGEKVVASMASLAHYMQELSWAGFEIADFVHEGTGAIWTLVLETRPAMHAGWMLVEEQAEGGDVLAERIRRDPGFTTGMARVCDGGGVALYRRTPPSDRSQQ